MLGFIGRGDYWDAEVKGDREKDSHTQIGGFSRSIQVPFTKTEHIGGGKINPSSYLHLIQGSHYFLDTWCSFKMPTLIFHDIYKFNFSIISMPCITNMPQEPRIPSLLTYLQPPPSSG